MLALLGATALPLVVALVDIDSDRGAIAPDVGASLVGAGMVSVLLFPLVAVRLAGRGPAGDESLPADEY